MAYEVGASLAIRNAQHLTPLTLSAKLARIELFFHILNIEREIYWQIGSITCAAYPLSQVDTIDVVTGSISHNSALNLVVFGVSRKSKLRNSLLSICHPLLTYDISHICIGKGRTLGVDGRCPGRSTKCQVEHFRQVSVLSSIFSFLFLLYSIIDQLYSSTRSNDNIVDFLTRCHSSCLCSIHRIAHNNSKTRATPPKHYQNFSKFKSIPSSR